MVVALQLIPRASSLRHMIHDGRTKLRDKTKLKDGKKMMMVKKEKERKRYNGPTDKTNEKTEHKK